MKKKFVWTGIIVCLIVTGIHLSMLWHNYQWKVVMWNTVAQETFKETLIQKIEQLGDTPILFYQGPSTTKTLNESFPDSVTIESEQGKRSYQIPETKFTHRLFNEERKNAILSVLLEEHPLHPDTLVQRWDSLLVQKGVSATIGVRLSTTDLLEQTSVTYSHGNEKVSPADSLLSCYMGFRCEVEATGYTSYPFWQVVGWKRSILLLLPWLGFCLVFLFYKKLILFYSHKFVKEKTIIIEKPVQVVNPADSPIYQLEEGVLFDTLQRTLTKGTQVQSLAPQVAILLKLFLQAKDCRLTEEEIYNNIWNGAGNSNKLYVLIRRLRQSLEGISTWVICCENGAYYLRKPHSPEKD